MVTAILFISFVLCMVIGIPIAFCLGLSSLITMLVGINAPLTLLVSRMFSGIDMFPLMAIPLFMLCGELMNTGGIINRVMSFADDLVGHVRGGLAHVNVLSSMLFGGITGSAVADTSALGSIEIPMMVKNGYDKNFSAAITGASSTVGPIIPPSIPAVIYAMAAQDVSVGALFMAGAIPGVVVCIGLMVLCYIIARKNNYPVRAGGLVWKKLARSTKRALVPLMTPIIIIGGILGGVFTPTEAASVAAFYALVVALFVTRELHISEIPGILVRSAVTSGIVLLVIATANIFAWIMATEQIPQLVSGFIVSISSSPWFFLLIVNVFLLIMGCFMDAAPTIIILVPILAPIATNFGIDPIHFGFIFIYTLMIGLITPPLGLCLFVSCGIAKISLEEISRAVLPFLILFITLMFVFTYVPSICLSLPRAFGLLG